jgi:hypothetical protein
MMFNKPKYIMKRMIKTAVIMIACFCFVNASAQSVMFINQVLDPIPGHSVDLENGVKAHNAKFHTSGESSARLFAIITGPRSGQYAWVQGPMSYASMDTPLTKEHTVDWDKNVGIHCRKVGELRFTKRDEERSYNPANEVTAEKHLARIFYGVSNPGQTLEAVGMIKKIYEAKKLTSARRVYTSEFRPHNDERVMLIYPFSSWEEFENHKGLPFDNLQEEMEKANGEGSWKKFQDLMSASNAGWYDEVRMMVK